jgi:hypothetical protein
LQITKSFALVLNPQSRPQVQKIDDWKKSGYPKCERNKPKLKRAQSLHVGASCIV